MESVNLRLVGSAGIVALFAAIVLFATVTMAGSARTSERAATPGVVCKKAVFGKRFVLRRKPRECLFHQRGAPPEAGLLAITVGENMNWKRWGARRAVARGTVFISSAGPKAARFTLSRPRKVCGKRVFTQLRVRLLAFNSGGTRQLTSCVR